MGRKNRNDNIQTNIISGSVINSNVQVGPEGVWIDGTYYPDGIPADHNVVNGRIVPRAN